LIPETLVPFSSPLFAVLDCGAPSAFSGCVDLLAQPAVREIATAVSNANEKCRGCFISTSFVLRKIDVRLYVPPKRKFSLTCNIFPISRVATYATLAA
jgi:hypothetical protein